MMRAEFLKLEICVEGSVANAANMSRQRFMRLKLGVADMINSLIRVALLSSALTLGMSANADAHHVSYACLDRGTSVTIHGKLEEIVFAMPHVVMKIRTSDARLVTAEWMTVAQLSQIWSIGPETLKAGDELVVKGTPYSCEKDKMSLLATVLRPANGWSWQSPLYK